MQGLAVDSVGRRSRRQSQSSWFGDETEDGSSILGSDVTGDDDAEYDVVDGSDMELHLVMEYCSGGTLAEYLREIGDSSNKRPEHTAESTAESSLSTSTTIGSELAVATPRALLYKTYAAVARANDWFSQLLSALCYMYVLTASGLNTCMLCSADLASWQGVCLIAVVELRRHASFVPACSGTTMACFTVTSSRRTSCSKRRTAKNLLWQTLECPATL